MPFGYFVLSCLYFFLPAYFTNMAPPLSRKAGVLKFLDRPVDFGKKYKGLAILGSHKTWRGVILGILAGMLAAWLQSYLYHFSFFKEISLFDYGKVNVFLFGFLISFGAVLGDLSSAFVKRRLRMEPGARFIPFDQTNYIFGAFLTVTPFLKLDFSIWVTIFVLTFFLHIVVTRLGYEIRLHKSKW